MHTNPYHHHHYHHERHLPRAPPPPPPLLPAYRLPLAGAVLEPLQVHVAEAGARHPLQAVHVVLVDLHAEHLRVALDVVPLGVGLQRLLQAGVLQPALQLRGLGQEVDDALQRAREERESVR